MAARLRATPALLEHGIDNLDPALAHPALLRRGARAGRAGAATRGRSRDEFDDASGRPRGRARQARSRPAAYERFGDHVESLVDKAHGDWAIGEARYDALLREAEGLGYGTRELREQGQAAYDELAADMRARARTLRGHDDFIAVVKEFNDDHPATPEEMLALYREATAAARAFCVEHELVTMPDGEQCEVVPSAPFSRGDAGRRPLHASRRRSRHRGADHAASGTSSCPTRRTVRPRSRSPRGWRPTTTTAPGRSRCTRPTPAPLAPRLAGRPGPEAAARVPLRSVFGSTYFVEGWGLYTEDLLREQGFFPTPEQELCQRDFRLFRAARIIVDTSLHLGEMTVEEAVDFMSTKTSLSRETAQAEVLRYCAWPTQASSYLTGALEIARMRQRWLHEARGSLRDFHDLAAGSGRLPIGLVERALFG